MGFKARTKAVLGLTVAGVAASILIPATAQASTQVTMCNEIGGTVNYAFEPVGEYPGINSPNLSQGECWFTWMDASEFPRWGNEYLNGKWQGIVYADSDGRVHPFYPM
ncbi:hypothetical protein [Actinoallomurus soli]|uniref:hypothetical protein n=1 Tax=Actinoallomurus soli TaxID=2952535 RepID=UPI002091F395|nr:hypothetical protein [Actinoallomurus soli]MCO5973450.1 hypothetical protein [Actinoallomurus soli]